MRIAILHYSKPPVIGGVERVMRDQARALTTLGHEVALLTRGEMEGEFDVIIVHNVFTMPFDLAWTRELHALAGSNPHIRWINWVHDVAAVNPSYAHLSWDDPEMAQLKVPPRALHVAVSEVRRAEYLSVTGLEESRCCVIPNGVDVASCLGLTERVADWVRDLRLWERDFVFVHPTRLLRRKNVEMGLRLTHAMCAAGLDVAYLVSGARDPHQADGLIYRAELNEMVIRLGVESHVFFLGETQAVSDDDMRGLYAISDALFFPSLSEGFGLPVIEAGLHAMPVFCSDIPAHREVGTGFAHFFPTDGEPGEIAEKIANHPGVKVRSDRRKELARKVDWARICVAYLEPLLNGDRHNP